jgi:hypothetical protein
MYSVITVEMDNDAFHADKEPLRELASILRQLAGDLDRMTDVDQGDQLPFMKPLPDSNGLKVGRVTVSNGDLYHDVSHTQTLRKRLEETLRLAIGHAVDAGHDRNNLEHVEWVKKARSAAQAASYLEGCYL